MRLLPFFRPWLFLPVLFAVLMLVPVLFVGCANQGNGPDGGPYDEAPPRIVGMTPPEKVAASKRTRFSLVFDELIKVDNPGEKITVSPPQSEQPEIKVSGRRITVELLDSLHPGTTYTVDFSDAITDNNEGNPLGQYTYIFSTGTTTDTMEISGHVLNAEDLEPMKGVLVGLHSGTADSLFTTTPFERVARTDGAGFFSVKGVSSAKDYSIFVLQDADADYRFSQPGEAIGWLDRRITPSAFPDLRHDTLWVDSVRYDSIRITPFTHFTPDDLVLLAFKEARQPRHFLKSQRDVPEWFRLFFTGTSTHVPTFRGLNFRSEGAFVEDRSLGLDTITYWLADTALLRLDTLRMAYTYEAWDDSTKANFFKTDTLELTPRTTFAKREEQRAKEMAKWEKQRERRHKRGDFSQEVMPPQFLNFNVEGSGSITPIQNLLLTFEQPLARLDTARLHLRLKVDTSFVDAPFVLDSIPGNLLARRLRAEWRPGQQYELVVDSAAVESIFFRHNNRVKKAVSVGKLEDYGTLFLNLGGADRSAVVQLLTPEGKVSTQVPVVDGRAELYYLRPGNYFVRCFFDRNGDGRWTPGEWGMHRQPEEVFYLPKALEVRADWDLNESWNLTTLPLDRQKPAALIKQKTDKKSINTRQRNLDRKKERGEG